MWHLTVRNSNNSKTFNKNLKKYTHIQNLVKFDHFYPVLMNSCALNQALCLERSKQGLGFRLTPDPKRNSYIENIDKDAGKNDRFLVPFQKLPNSSWHALSFQESNQSKMPNPHFRSLTEFKIVYASM